MGCPAVKAERARWPARLGMVLLAGLVAACGPREAPPEPGMEGADLTEFLGGDAAGFARATEPRPFVFPADHGPHPDFRSEWWYFTGNLETPAGRPFGFQLTLFRFALAPEAPGRASAWATRQSYMGHFALADIAGGGFHPFQRLARGAAGLAGAEAEPLRVWLEDWVVTGRGGERPRFTLEAEEAGVGVRLELESTKPLVLQGERGLSQKSAEPGNASYYYSLTRLAARGRVTVAGETHPVTGEAWLDREWSTSALGPDQAGWDWFALQLEDGRELMYYQLRRRDGSVDPHSAGVLVAADGSYRRVGAGEVDLAVTGRWESPRDGALYPARWRLRVADLDLEVTPRLADQELDLLVRYWEGAVAVAGTAGGRPVSGRGYVELTGYAGGEGPGAGRQGADPR